MSYPTVIFGAPAYMPYETYTGDRLLRQKGRLPLGTMIWMQDGRKFRFCLNGGTALVQGNVITSAAPIGTDVGMTPAAGAVGDRLITFTHGAATTIANYFSEGYAVISITPGGGDLYKINDHLALTNATAGDVVNFSLGYALRRAITVANSKVDLIPHPYCFVIAAAQAVSAAVAGVAVSAIPATSGTGWLQTQGPCGVLTSGTNIIGTRAAASVGAAAAGPLTATATTYDNEITIGVVAKVAANAAWSTINLTMEGHAQ
jgi:hypothetical protein